MTLSAFLIQLLNGLAGASSLFLVSAGLSLIFGVTRIVNFAHGSLMMLGAYLAYSLIARLGGGAAGYWTAIVIAALIVGGVGVAVERLLLRRLYVAPELLQLTATFGVVLIVKDVVLATWGPEDLLGRRAPGLGGAVSVLGRAIPQYDLLLIVLSPLILLLLTWMLKRTRWGVLVRAASEDREMTALLGVNQALLFSGVFFLGATLAGLAGALQLPREPANLNMDLSVIAEVFVVTVVGGLGSIPGAFIAALIIGVAKALCVAAGAVSVFGVVVSFPKLTLVAEFIVMAIVLAIRPWGLFGRPLALQSSVGRDRLQPPGRRFAIAVAASFVVLAALPLFSDEYTVVLMTDVAIFALFAASLHFMMGPGGMASFGHAAYFGLAAYAAALLAKGVPMELALLAAPLAAGVAALLYGWFCVRLSGVYLAMLTLAFAQITWSIVFEWDAVTGGSNGLTGVWPAQWLSSRRAYYWLTLSVSAMAIIALWRMIFSPFGYALRASRDSLLRASAIGIDPRTVQWAGFSVAGLFAGLGGALYAFSKGSISPETLAIPRSIDVLVMVLLGGLQSLVGPVVGAATLTALQDSIIRHTEYWRAVIGITVIALVLLFPNGLAGVLKRVALTRNAT
ncbi:MAG TPA: ABC transporter permease [Casimicrobiaceae bacterium]|nr:ABC transporter permease [Casimicrobiaceae bacterium]